MINPVCNRCGKELNEFGAILLSPPEGDSVKKMHLCLACYSSVIKDFSKI